MTCLIGFSSGYRAMMDCDTLLMLGTNFPYWQFFHDAQIAQIDIRPENIGRRAPLALGLVGDLGAPVETLLPMLKPKSDSSQLAESRASCVKAREGPEDLAAGKPGHKPIHPQYLMRVLSEEAYDDAILPST
jgi:pyruvate dehydrogenase (quinone)